MNFLNMNIRRFKRVLNRIARLPKDKYLIYYVLNKVWHFYLKLIKSTKVAYPSVVMLELTNHCNLDCITCPRVYDYGKVMDTGFMDVDRCKIIIDEIWPYLDSVVLTGLGETFLYQSLAEIVDYIKGKNKGIIISISTNAVVTDFLGKASKIIGQVDIIQISIDGLGNVYDMIRKNSNFIIFDKNVRTLSKMCKNTHTELRFNMVVTRDNFHQMSKLVSYAEETGIKYINFNPFNLVSATTIEPSYYDFLESKVFSTAISQLQKTRNISPVIITGINNFRTNNGFQNCGFPWTHFYICWNGFVPPCCSKPFPKEYSFGNIFNNKMMEILNNDSYRKFRAAWFKNEIPGFCYKCHAVYAGTAINNSN